MKRVRLAVGLLFLFSTGSLVAKDVYLSVSGKANGFFSDARIFNPSYDKDIVVSARYLPAGNGDNSGVAPVQLTIPKRTMKVYDDAVQSMFGGGPLLGAIRLTSDDDFVATQRIYADLTGQGKGTLGQFVPGLEPSVAIKKGVLLQLKLGQASLGNFRTNWGGMNPNPVVANVSFKLYDKTNTLAGTNNLTLQPFGVFSPANVAGFFGNPDRDLTDAWIAFESDQPVFFYASIVDNTSTDPTFIPAATDSGVAPIVPELKTLSLTARDFAFDLSQSATIRPGDRVRVTVGKQGGTHGVVILTPNGAELLRADTLTNAGATTEVTFPVAGSYVFVCTNGGCGIGHGEMSGEITVQP
jgi:plastocyanin